ncbi:MAG: glycerol-3-phosphate dehydrogenase subunit [Clostridia bacterium]|nr:glycerol-3-phosphate dehydrogenase subunit [Clostridia bacterium]MDN5322059.1 glycerol-3-phosphate dehydrogenase subunit [Clostridia bacterium]
MNYDVVVIGAGLAGFSAALAAVKEGKQVLVIAKGMGNLYSSSGYIDLLGYYPTTSKKPVVNPQKILDSLIVENPNHPYAKVGKDIIIKAFNDFLLVSEEMGLPYTGSLNANMMMPTAAGALVPTTLYPKSTDKKITVDREIVVVGIKELVDFYPAYVAQNLELQLGRKVKPLWIDLQLNISRELNSYDLALALEKPQVRNGLIDQLINLNVRDSLILIPAVLGVTRWQEVISNIEQSLNCELLEIPTLPPSVMGYRLAESFKLYLKNKGVEFIIGYPVAYAKFLDGYCEEISIYTANDRLKKIKAQNFCLATGGILGEGLQVLPREIKEDVFGLPIQVPREYSLHDFFSLEGQPLSYAGVNVNDRLQPFDPQTKETLLKNVFVAGATLAGYDPFVEKSGNGVALTSGYKAGLLAAKGGILNE